MGPADSLVVDHVVYPHAFFNQVDADGALYHIKGFDYKVDHYDSHGGVARKYECRRNYEDPYKDAVEQECDESLSA